MPHSMLLILGPLSTMSSPVNLKIFFNAEPLALLLPKQFRDQASAMIDPFFGGGIIPNVRFCHNSPNIE